MLSWGAGWAMAIATCIDTWHHRHWKRSLPENAHAVIASWWNSIFGDMQIAKTSMKPEDEPLEEEIPFGIHHFDIFRHSFRDVRWSIYSCYLVGGKSNPRVLGATKPKASRLHGEAKHIESKEDAWDLMHQMLTKTIKNSTLFYW